METIRKVHKAHYRDHKPILEICRDYHLSRNAVRKILRSDVTEFVYERKVQPRLKQRFFNQRRKFASQEELNQWLAEQCIHVAGTQKHPEFPNHVAGDEECKYSPMPGSPLL